jgi:hypothetical protein
MSDSIFFDLKIRDFVSEGLQKLKAVSANVFTDIDKDVMRVKRDMEDLGRTVKPKANVGDIDRVGKEANRAKKELTDLGRTVKPKVDTSDIERAEREIRKVKRGMDDMGGEGGSTGRGGGIGIGGIALGSMIGQGVMMAGRQVTEAGKFALENGMEFQKQIVGLSTFVGDKKAYDIVDRVAREGALTPYTTRQLLPLERGQIAMGADPDKAHKDTWALANSVAATGGSDWALERMGWHMQQARGQGYIDGRIMREFSMAGIPITTLLQDSIPSLKHMSQAKAMNKLDNMTLSYDLVSDALYKASQKGGMFYDAMNKLSQTIGGKWSTIKDKMEISGWKLTESQDKNIKKLEDGMIGFADKLPGMIGSIAPVVGRLFDAFNDLWPTVEKFGGSMMDVFKPIGDLLISKEFTELSKSVIDVATDITKTLKPAITELAGGLKSTLGNISDLINELRGKKSELPKPVNTWHFGDPFFESNAAAAARENRNAHPLFQQWNKDHAPFIESMAHARHRELWSGAPDLEYTANKGKGVFGSSPQTYNTDMPEKKGKKSSSAGKRAISM